MEKRERIVAIFKTILVILLLVGVAMIFVISFTKDRSESYGDTITTTNTQQIKTPYIEVSPFDGEVYLVGDIVVEWLNGSTSAIDLYQQYSSHGKVYSSKSVLLNYSIYNIPDGETVVSQQIELSQNSDFANSEIYELVANKRNIRFENLYTGKTYYYQITAVLSDETTIQTRGQFKTAATPRIIMLDGPRNVRDIGGWGTVYGKNIKQGMFYRGSELDGAISLKYYATQSDVQLLKEFGIKTEFDLRYYRTDNIKDMLGSDVKHNFYTFLAYNDCFTPKGEPVLKNVIRDLAVAENYPIYLHCSYGADRTGTICFIVGAILGMSDEDLYKEWELSVLCNGGAFYEEMNLFLQTLDTLEGDSIHEKVCNYLLYIGVTQQELDSIREILLED